MNKRKKPAKKPTAKNKPSALASENKKLRAAITAAIDMHLGRCASSEPFKAADYRHHACEARDILRAALSSKPDEVVHLWVRAIDGAGNYSKPTGPIKTSRAELAAIASTLSP